MCRLLGYVAAEERTFADVVGEGFENFVELSKEHKHGWGISACSTDTRKTELVRDLTLAAESEKFADSSKNLKSDGALLHLRLASKGLTVDLSNNHPFIYGDYSFMHNGTIKSIDSVQQFVDPRYLDKFTSTTDSERYFFTVLTCIDELGLIEGVRSIVNLIRTNADYTALNIMVQTPDTLIAVCEFNEANKTDLSCKDRSEGAIRAI